MQTEDMTHHQSSTSRDYQQPFNWWGYRTTPEQPLSLVELIHRGTLDEQIGAFLWMAMEQRASLIVAATPHEAGKTTMLTALLDFLPEGTERIYLRGWYERFEFVEDERDPASAYLLSNEISSHLPIYMWGRGVRKLFEAAAAGYGFGATVHADGATEVLRMMANYPLEVPEQMLSEIDLVLTLSYRPGVRNSQRRMMKLEVIEDAGGRPAPKTIASRDVIGTELQYSPGTLINTLVRSFGLERSYVTNELAQRVSLLRRLVRGKTFDSKDVQKAVRRLRKAHATSHSEPPAESSGR
jgi:hypothetical protein